VLSTPPAFVLSQDQTLQTKPNRAKAREKEIRRILTKQTTTPLTTGYQGYGQKNNNNKYKNHQTHY
jgi:hypothetical protein